jgi:hypothetical protein
MAKIKRKYGIPEFHLMVPYIMILALHDPVLPYFGRTNEKLPPILRRF